MNRFKVFALFSSIVFISACSNAPKEEEIKTVEAPKQEIPSITSPSFNEDSAYSFLKKQVDFGPRVPGTKAHAACAQYFQNKLKNFGFRVELQQGTVTTFDGSNFQLKNIFASYNSQLSDRILLTAHWDSRPFADSDTKNVSQPIDGANDGASGAAVLLEIARLIAENKPNIGIDIFLNDLEDYGEPEGGMMLQRKEDTWCLGTQYWAKNKPKEYQPKFGILLDMVGGQNPSFPKEGTSMAYAPEIVEKVWNAAARLGYGNYFINARTGQTTDDHLYINSIAKIPCIDIVHMDPSTGTYPAFHHTHNDNLNIIEKSTLKMVGQTVMQVIYEELKAPAVE
jgi:glutaminyl-peptide cyclotransferase